MMTAKKQRVLVLFFVALGAAALTAQAKLHIELDTVRGALSDSTNAEFDELCPYRLGKAVELLGRYELLAQGLLHDLDTLQNMILGGMVLVAGAAAWLFFQTKN